MLHLLLADLVWVAAVLLCAVALAEEPAAAVAPEGLGCGSDLDVCGRCRP